MITTYPSLPEGVLDDTRAHVLARRLMNEMHATAKDCMHAVSSAADKRRPALYLRSIKNALDQVASPWVLSQAGIKGVKRRAFVAVDTAYPINDEIHLIQIRTTYLHTFPVAVPVRITQHALARLLQTFTFRSRKQIAGVVHAVGGIGMEARRLGAKENVTFFLEQDDEAHTLEFQLEHRDEEVDPVAVLRTVIRGATRGGRRRVEFETMRRKGWLGARSCGESRAMMRLSQAGLFETSNACVAG